jgi:hypothetical protein
VKKTDSTGTTLFVYNAAGQLVVEYVSGAPTGGGTSYITADHLGSTRVVTDQNGAVKARLNAKMSQRKDYTIRVVGRSSLIT